VLTVIVRDACSVGVKQAGLGFGGAAEGRLDLFSLCVHCVMSGAGSATLGIESSKAFSGCAMTQSVPLHGQ